MIKRIIFDFDNTLVIWKEEYKYAIKETLEYYNIDIDYHDFDDTIEQYDKECAYYSKDNLIAIINKKYNLNLGIDFLDYWLEKLGKMSCASDELIDLLEYLSSKYELVVLTNWFGESQIARMKHANIYKYFKEVYSGEEVVKPNKNAFLRALGDKKVDECIMVGDNYNIDIKPAMDLGIKTYMVSSKKVNNVNTIKNIIELKEML